MSSADRTWPPSPSRHQAVKYLTTEENITLPIERSWTPDCGLNVSEANMWSDTLSDLALENISE